MRGQYQTRAPCGPDSPDRKPAGARPIDPGTGPRNPGQSGVWLCHHWRAATNAAAAYNTCHRRVN
ncbi:hypothetical protein F7R19_12140 [Cupriavidus pauculus]|nr:hypothetical protein F7R19_12140 [Cupriavidus pauculus]